MTDQTPPPAGALALGRIASTPAGGLVDVVIPTFDGGEQKFTECPFLPGAVDPVLDDDCVVGFVTPHTAWVLSWSAA